MIQEIFNCINNITNWFINNTDPVSALTSLAALLVSILAYRKAGKVDLYEKRIEVIKKVIKLIEVYEGLGCGYVGLFGGCCADNKILNERDEIKKSVLMLFGASSEKELEEIISIGNECLYVDKLFNEYDYLIDLYELDIRQELTHFYYDNELEEQKRRFYDENELNSIDISDHKFYLDTYNLNDIFSRYNSAHSKLFSKKSDFLSSLYMKTKT